LGFIFRGAEQVTHEDATAENWVKTQAKVLTKPHVCAFLYSRRLLGFGRQIKPGKTKNGYI